MIGVLAGCGFRPVNKVAAGGSGDKTVFEALSSIRIGRIPDREGQQFRNKLIDQLTPRGEPANPEFVLNVRLQERRSTVSVEETSFATRANLRISTQFTLFDVKTRKRVFTGRSQAVTSFNILGGEFATIAQERNARVLAFQQVSEDVRNKLSVFLSRFEREPASQLGPETSRLGPETPQQNLRP